MKNALILHGTDATPEANWFPWLKNELEQRKYKVNVPQLPKANRPNLQRYNEFLLSRYSFNKDTVIIGHSSGSVAALGLLQALPSETKVKLSVLTGVFCNDLGWDVLSELFEKPFDYKKIKQQSQKFIVLHSDNDQHIPLDQARYVCDRLEGDMRVLEGMGHFNI
jgi:hypothetical protein